jgi:hypothetical protein
MVIGPPKSARSRRTIPLPDIAVDKMDSRQRSQRIERELAGESGQENGLVFSTGIGTIIEPSNLRRGSTTRFPSLASAVSASTICVTRARRSFWHEVFHCAS